MKHVSKYSPGEKYSIDSGFINIICVHGKYIMFRRTPTKTNPPEVLEESDFDRLLQLEHAEFTDVFAQLNETSAISSGPCKKIKYNSEKTANHYIYLLKDAEKSPHIRSYICPDCNVWHITTRQDWREVTIRELQNVIDFKNGEIKDQENKIKKLGDITASLHKVFESLCSITEQDLIALANKCLHEMEFGDGSGKELTTTEVLVKYFKMLDRVPVPYFITPLPPAPKEN